MDQEKQTALDAHVANLKRQLANAQRLRELLEESPELEQFLTVPANAAGAKHSSTNGRVGKTVSKPGTASGGPVARAHFNKIARWLLSQGNKAQTTKAIMAATDLTRSDVVQTLYKTHRSSFEKSNAAGSKLKKEWKLKAGVAEKIAELEK